MGLHSMRISVLVNATLLFYMQSFKSAQKYFYIISIIISQFLNYIKNLFSLVVFEYISYKNIVMPPLN